jgi:hypothetical protein
MRKDKVRAWIVSTLLEVDAILATNGADTWAQIEALCATGGEGQMPAYARSTVKDYALRKLAERKVAP